MTRDPAGSRRPLRVEALVTELPVPGQATVSKPPLTLVLAIDYEGYSVWNETVTSHYRCCQHLSSRSARQPFLFSFPVVHTRHARLWRQGDRKRQRQYHTWKLELVGATAMHYVGRIDDDGTSRNRHLDTRQHVPASSKRIHAASAIEDRWQARSVCRRLNFKATLCVLLQRRIFRLVSMADIKRIQRGLACRCRTGIRMRHP